ASRTDLPPISVQRSQSCGPHCYPEAPVLAYLVDHVRQVTTPDPLHALLRTQLMSQLRMPTIELQRIVRNRRIYCQILDWNRLFPLPKVLPACNEVLFLVPAVSFRLVHHQLDDDRPASCARPYFLDPIPSIATATKPRPVVNPLQTQTNS